MTENPLGYEKISKLLKNFAVPSIVASLIGSIYNIAVSYTHLDVYKRQGLRTPYFLILSCSSII